jgi:hypothetical protein
MNSNNYESTIRSDELPLKRVREKLLNGEIFKFYNLNLRSMTPPSLKRSARGCDVGMAEPLYDISCVAFAQYEDKIYFDYTNDKSGMCKAWYDDSLKRKELAYIDSNLDLVSFITHSITPTSSYVGKYNKDFVLVFEN